MAEVFTDRSMASMVHAIEANLFSFFPLLSRWPRAQAHDEPELLWTLSDVPYPLFNSVGRARLARGRVVDAIDLAIGRCRARNVPLLWWTGPATAPTDLEACLADRGFFIDESVGMALPLDARPAGEAGPCGLEVEEVRTAGGLAEWVRVLCDGFGAPEPFGRAFADMAATIGLGETSPFRHYLGRLAGEPVATCSVLLGGGVAGLYNVSTRPGWRRRGIGAAVTRATVTAARDQGYRLAILHASELGAGVYRSIGFRALCRIGQCVWVPEEQCTVDSSEFTVGRAAGSVR